ncbi:MAG: hypothetical protein WAM66_13230 [Acidobacteriaceae bacterium]
MINRIMTKACFLSTAALLLGMVFFASGWTPAYGDAAQTSKLLQQVKTSAAQLKRDSAEMEVYSRSRLAWQSHASQINVIKEHINNSGKVLEQLHNSRDDAEPWQQDAIDKITPLLQELASNTESAIDHLNANKQTWHPEYEAYLKSNAEVSTDLSNLINDYIEFGKADSRTKAMEQKLGFSGM